MLTLDDSPESYLQYYVLSLMGEQFHFFWHAYYNDTLILCDESDLKRVRADMNKEGMEFPDSVKEEMAELDFTPYVIVNEDTVEVRIMTFTKWGGFYEETYIMSRELPVEILDFDYDILIEYDCPLVY